MRPRTRSRSSASSTPPAAPGRPERRFGWGGSRGTQRRWFGWTWGWARGTLRIRERWPFGTWFIVGFLAVWGTGAGFAISASLRQGLKASGIAPLCLLAAIGTGMWVGIVVGLARKRRWIDISSEGLRDVRLLLPSPVVPWDAVREVSMMRGSEDAPERFSVITERGAMRVGAWLSGWPMLLAEASRRAPPLTVRLPDALAPRIAALRDGLEVRVHLSLEGEDPLRYSFRRLYAQQLRPMAMGFVLFTAFAGVITATVGGPVLMVLPFVWSPFALIMLCICIDYFGFRTRARLELHADHLLIVDGLGRESDVPWGSVVSFSSDDQQGGGYLRVHTPLRTVQLRREFTNVERIEAALEQALRKVDAQLQGRV